MTNIFTKAIFATLISISALGATSATANAGGVGVEIQVGNPSYYGGYHHGGYVYRGRCQPWLALDKARWHGVRRAHVAAVGPNRVVVEGGRGYHWDRVVFANIRGCPVLRG